MLRYFFAAGMGIAVSADVWHFVCIWLAMEALIPVAGKLQKNSKALNLTAYGHRGYFWRGVK